MLILDPLQLLLALALDFFIGNPPQVPHVTKMIAWFADYYEDAIVRNFTRTILSGALFWFIVVASVVGAAVVIHAVLAAIPGHLDWFFDVFILYQCLAIKEMTRRVRQVQAPLQQGHLPLARAQLTNLVTRDTGDLDESGISRAVLEALARKSDDSFFAPLFWAILAGMPGALLYCAVNMLDELVGHRNTRYELFGKCAARANDVMSYLPARLSALLSLLLYQRRGWKQVPAEARTHVSPNAGWGEAAMAYALDLRLGGVNEYEREPVEEPLFNPQGRPPLPQDIAAGVSWWWKIAAFSSGIFISLALARFFVFYFLFKKAPDL